MFSNLFIDKLEKISSKVTYLTSIKNAFCLLVCHSKRNGKCSPHFFKIIFVPKRMLLNAVDFPKVKSVQLVKKTVIFQIERFSIYLRISLLCSNFASRKWPWQKFIHCIVLALVSKEPTFPSKKNHFSFLFVL